MFKYTRILKPVSERKLPVIRKGLQLVRCSFPQMFIELFNPEKGNNILYYELY